MAKGNVEIVTGHRVRLPPGVRSPYEVYLNGVRQELGPDFHVTDGELVFARKLVRARVAAGAWWRMAWWTGTYKGNDSVDVRYEVRGESMLAQDLPLIPD